MSAATVLASGMIMWLVFQSFYGLCQGEPIFIVYDVALDPSQQQATAYGVGPGGPWDLSYINDPNEQGTQMQADQAPVQGAAGQTSSFPTNGLGLIQFVSPSGASISIHPGQSMPQITFGQSPQNLPVQQQSPPVVAVQQSLPPPAVSQPQHQPTAAIQQPSQFPTDQQQQSLIQQQAVPVDTFHQPAQFVSPGQVFDIYRQQPQYQHYARSYDVNNYPFQYSGPSDSSAFLPMSNKANGNVINSGSALQGSLFANGKSNTNTDAGGALSTGNGQIGGSGLGIQGTSVNSAGASTGGGAGGLSSLFPSGAYPFGPSSGISNALFLNSLAAAKGTVSGNSNTLSKTGPNGNSFGSSIGSATGQGQGIQLTQVANSDSEGTGFGGNRFKRAVPSVTSSGSFESSIPPVVNSSTILPTIFGVSAEMDPLTGTVYTYYTNAIGSSSSGGQSAAISSVAASSSN